jgi:hypothetical protein
MALTYHAVAAKPRVFLRLTAITLDEFRAIVSKIRPCSDNQIHDFCCVKKVNLFLINRHSAK